MWMTGKAGAIGSMPPEQSGIHTCALAPQATYVDIASDSEEEAAEESESDFSESE